MFSETMAFESRIQLLVLLVYITGSASGTQCLPVSCDKRTICALKASSVNLTCSYSSINITTGFWFNVKDKAKWRNAEHPEDLAFDSDYAGRVIYVKLTNLSSTITLTDLRERDSGEYRLMLITDKGEKCLSSAGVILTVTDLQVTHVSMQRALTCRTSCLLTTATHRYYWYKDGQYLSYYTNTLGTFSLGNDDKSSYSCSVHGHNDILSRPLCVGENCWSVTYPEERVCVLKGSSVEFAGLYSLPSDRRVKIAFWHSREDIQDLKGEKQFIKRVEYVNKNRNSTLKMNQLSKEDSGEYRLRIITDDGKPFSGKPGVVVKVTDLQVRASDSGVASEGQTEVTLSCITSCTLSNNPTYIWYKNGQPVTDKPTKHNKLYLISSDDTGSYSCAVRGREDLRSPEQSVTLPEPKAGNEEHCSNCSSTQNIAIAVGVAVCLSLIIIAALWMWRRSRSVKSPSPTEDPNPQTGQDCGRKPENMKETHEARGEHANSMHTEDEIHYSSINFPRHTQGSPLSPGGRFPQGTAEDEHVQYAEVNIKRPT